MRIFDVPMKCQNCGAVYRLDDCNIDDPFGDGTIGCPVSDCGGAMEEAENLAAPEKEE